MTTTTIVPRPTVDPDQIIAGFDTALRSKGLADRTREVYLQTARSYVGAVDPLTVTAGEVEAYLAALDVSRSTLAQYQVRLRRFHGFLVRDGYRESNPLDMVERPKVPQRMPRPLPDEYLAAIWRAATPRERAWIALGVYCGLRAGEATAVRVEDIEGRTLVVRGKGDRERRVPLRPEVIHALELAGWPEAGRFFPTASRTRASIAIGALLRQAGAPERYTFHSLRHRFGTEVYRASRDIKVTAEILGHASIQTTLVYAAADTEHATTVVDSLPNLL